MMTDFSHLEAQMQAAGWEVAGEWMRPSVLFRPRLFLDGNKFCALYGDDLMAGCAGFGDTPGAAMEDFDRNWHAQAPSARED